jgi:hypothetical protein
MRHDTLPERCSIINQREAAKDTEAPHRHSSAELRIVRDMRASHQQTILTNNRRPNDSLMYLDKLANTRTITNHNALSAMRRPDTTRIRSAMLRRRTHHRIRANVDTITDRERPRQDRRLKHLTISTNDYLAMRLVNDHRAASTI